MPLYEFFCSDCRAKFEVLTSYENSRGAMICATCHGANVRKLLSVVARPVRSGGSDGLGDFGDDYSSGEEYGASSGGGGCGCGGACSCGGNN
ncbi:MAG: zinc ribbon domain-containing protein [Ktedonobacterales bacterium]|jgi:putative FmdB family regulatory protein